MTIFQKVVLMLRNDWNFTWIHLTFFFFFCLSAWCILTLTPTACLWLTGKATKVNKYESTGLKYAHLCVNGYGVLAKLKIYINVICIWASTRIWSIFCSSSNADDSWKKITLHLWKEMHLSFCLCAYVQIQIHLTLMFAANPKMVRVLWLIRIS